MTSSQSKAAGNLLHVFHLLHRNRTCRRELGGSVLGAQRIAERSRGSHTLQPLLRSLYVHSHLSSTCVVVRCLRTGDVGSVLGVGVRVNINALVSHLVQVSRTSQGVLRGVWVLFGPNVASDAINLNRRLRIRTRHHSHGRCLVLRQDWDLRKQHFVFVGVVRRCTAES